MNDITIIARMLPVYKIITTIIGTMGIVAALIWLVTFLMNVIVEGLKLLSNSYAEATALLAGMPVVHFLFMVLVACLIVVVAVKMVRFSVRFAFGGVSYVR